MSPPGRIACKAPTGTVLCWCDLAAAECYIYIKATRGTRNFQLKLFTMTGTGQFMSSLNIYNQGIVQKAEIHIPGKFEISFKEVLAGL